MFRKRKKLAAVALLVMLSFAVSIYGILPYGVKAEAKSAFSDVDNHWSKATVLWALEKGIVSGYGDGTFRPNQQVTEAEFLTMLIRTYHPEIQNSQSGHWADAYYGFAKKMNYPVLGGDDLKLRNNKITRLQVAELISAAQGVNYQGNDAVRYLLGNGLASGNDPNNVTIASFNPNGYLTRAEAVQFIKNVVEKGKGELLARPKQPSDPSILPNIPLGIQYDLPYKPPAGWIPPKIKSEATDDVRKDSEILEKELGFLSGTAYNPYGGQQRGLAVILITSGTKNHSAQINFSAWYGSKNEEDDFNKIPYVARELFKFYLPNEYNKLFNIMNDGYNGKDVSKYINKPFTLDGREIKIIELENSVTVVISKKGKPVE